MTPLNLTLDEGISDSQYVVVKGFIVIRTLDAFHISREIMSISEIESEFTKLTLKED